MKSEYKSEVNLLINMYRGEINLAQRAMQKYLVNPDRALLVKQCEHYKKAAELCGQISQYYPSKDDKDEWEENQKEAEQEFHRVCDLATNRPARVAPDYFAGMYHSADASGINPAAYGAAKTASKASAAPKTASKPKGSAASGSSDEVPEEVVQSWIRNEPPKHGFDQVSGMQDLVKKLRNYVSNVAVSRFKAHMGIGRSKAFFLYGPPGCGKTYIINAFVHELMKQGYSYMKLSGAKIHAPLLGQSEKRVERAFQEARRRAPCILFIDEVEAVCRDRNTPMLPNHALSTTNAFLDSFNEMVDDNKPVIFIGATNYPQKVDIAMADRTEMIPIPLPDLPAKENKLRMMLEGKLVLEPGLTYADLAEDTDNFNYRDFDRLLVNLTETMTEELIPIYGNDEQAGEAMIKAVTSGEFPLTRELYNKVIRAFQPSKKDDIIRSLDSWCDQFQKHLDN